MREIVFSYLNYAQANISGHRVAAAVFAMRKARSKSKTKLETESNVMFRVFGGCNLEISISTVLHAEAIALYKALSEGYTKIQAVGVTSDHEDQIKPLCGACRQLYMYINPMTTIYVFGKDKKVKLEVKLIDTMNYPYTSRGKIT
ncbi:MAG: cytidine deaminase family protein [Nitrososphaeraceae archaeon]